jgi:hypothetical protein
VFKVDKDSKDMAKLSEFESEAGEGPKAAVEGEYKKKKSD